MVKIMDKELKETVDVYDRNCLKKILLLAASEPWLFYAGAWLYQHQR